MLRLIPTLIVNMHECSLNLVKALNLQQHTAGSAHNAVSPEEMSCQASLPVADVSVAGGSGGGNAML